MYMYMIRDNLDSYASKLSMIYMIQMLGSHQPITNCAHYTRDVAGIVIHIVYDSV